MDEQNSEPKVEEVSGDGIGKLQMRKWYKSEVDEEINTWISK